MAFENLYNIYNNKNENGLKIAIKKVELSQDYNTLYKDTIQKKFFKHSNHPASKKDIKEKKVHKNVFYRCCGLFK